MLEPPLDEADPAFECIGGTFWVKKNDDEVGVRARTRLLELSALFAGDALHAIVEPLVANRREGGGCGGRVSLRALGDVGHLDPPLVTFSMHHGIEW